MQTGAMLLTLRRRLLQTEAVATGVQSMLHRRRLPEQTSRGRLVAVLDGAAWGPAAYSLA